MPALTALTNALIRSAPPLRERADKVSDLEERLQELAQQGQQAWPTLAGDASDFVAHLGSVATTDEDLVAWLDRVRADDLWLAFACTAGESRAVAAFEAHFAADLQRIINRFVSPQRPADDLLQILRDKLFVGGQTKPKVATYSGVGFLQNWLRITAVRAFVDLTRGKSGRSPDTPLDEAYADAGDFEVDFLKQRYRSEFKEAFSDAMADLEPEARNLLRYRVQGLSVDRIAAVEGVHRATAARRVAKARESLLSNTKDRLGARLSVPKPELDSIMRMINSRLDVSIERILTPTE